MRHPRRPAVAAIAGTLIAGALVPLAPGSASANGTVTVTATLPNTDDEWIVDQVEVLYADPAAWVPVEKLETGPSIEAYDAPPDGVISFEVPSEKPFYVRISSGESGYIEKTYLGDGGATSSSYPAVDPIEPTPDLALGTLLPIRSGTIQVSTNIPASYFELERLDGESVGTFGSGSATTSFTRNGIVPGTYRMSAYGRTGGATTNSSFTVKPGETTAVSLALRRYATLKGKVVDKTGKPLRNVTIGVKSSRDFTLSQNSTRTDKQGRYSMAYLDPGSYRVTFAGATGTSAARYLDAKPKKVTLAAGAKRTLKTVKLAKGGVATATVKVGKNQGFEVSLLKKGVAVSGDWGHRSRSRKGVKVVTRGVKTGTYTLLVHKDSGRYIKKKVKIKKGRTTKVGTLKPTRKPVTVEATVKGAIDGSAYVSSKPTASYRLAGVGRLNFRNGRVSGRVVPGTWYFSVQATTATTEVETRTPVKIKVTKSRRVSIPVTTSAYLVDGTLTFQGRPVADTYVAAYNDARKPGQLMYTVRFYGERSDSTGHFRGAWGVDTPESTLAVSDDHIFEEGPLHFGTSVTTVSKPADVTALELILKGG